MENTSDPLDEEEAYAHRRAKGLSSAVRTLIQKESKITADEVYARHGVEAEQTPSALSTLGSKIRHGISRGRSSDQARAARPDEAAVLQEDLEAAALADLVIEQYTHLKKHQLNLVTKAKARSAVRAAKEVATLRSRKWQPNRLHFRGKALGFLTVDNPIRWGAIYICTHGLDELALILIFINTVMLMFYDPHDIAEYNPDNVRRAALTLGDQITSVLFALEVLLRVIAQGAIYGSSAFLADGWGWLDLLIAVTGLLQDFLPKGTLPNMSIIRVAKILKPLRVITHIPQLRLIVIFILNVLPVLNIVLILVVFIYFVFGVIGVQLFAGVLSQQCYNHESGLQLPSGAICALDLDQGSAHCPADYTCLPLGKGIRHGIVTFDSVGASVMTVVQVVTLQGWTELLELLQGAQSWWISIYFVVLVLLGPLFVMKLFLAIISNKLKQMQKQNKVHQQAEMMRSLDKRRLRRVLMMWEEGAYCSRIMHSESWGQFRAMQVRPYLTRWMKSRTSALNYQRLNSAGVGVSVVKEDGEGAAKVLSLRPGGAALESGQIEVGDYITHVDGQSLAALTTEQINPLLFGRRGSRLTLTVDRSRRRKAGNADGDRTDGFIEGSEGEGGVGEEGWGDGDGAGRASKSKRGKRRKGAAEEKDVVTIALVRKLLPTLDYEEQLIKEQASQEKEVKNFYEEAKRVLEPITGKIEEPVPWRQRLHDLVESEYFADGLSFVIVLNTMLLGVQHELDSPIGSLWTQNDAMLQYLQFRAGSEGANLAFLLIYTLELVLKVVGLGFKEYLSRGANLVDATIVVLGFYELVGVLELFICFLNAARAYEPSDSTKFTSPCQDSNAALSVFRAFRLVRLIKFFRRFPSFQRQVNRMLEMVKPVSTLGVLICLFLFIFCVLGQTLLGGAMYVQPNFLDIRRGEFVYLQLPDDNLPLSLPLSLFNRGRPGVVEVIDVENHPLKPFRVSKRLSFSSVAMDLSLSAESSWAALSSRFSTSPKVPSKNPSKFSATEVQVKDMIARQGMDSTAAYGLFELPPFEPIASQLPDQTRVSTTSPVIAHRVPRSHFDTFAGSLLTVMQVMSMTDWQFVMYDACAVNGQAMSMYFYLLLFLGSYVLMNLFAAIVIVGFGDQKGQIDILERDTRDLAMLRFKMMRLIKDSVYKTLSIDLCAFPGPNCSKGGLSLWQMLPFRQDVKLIKQKRGLLGGDHGHVDTHDEQDEGSEDHDPDQWEALEVTVINHDYVEVAKSIRGIAQYILGSVDWGFLGSHHPTPQLYDVEKLLKDLTTSRVAAKNRGTDGEIIPDPGEDAEHRFQGGRGGRRRKVNVPKRGSTVIPALIEKATGSVEENRVYVAVEFLYRFWDSVSANERKMHQAAVADRPLTDEQMQTIMRNIIDGKDLDIVMQARRLAGKVELGNFLNLKMPNGTTRCQGMVGLTTQCPQDLDCEEHRDINQKFLKSYQLLKGAAGEGVSSASNASKDRVLEVENLKTRIKDMSKDKFGVPYTVMLFLTWNNPLRKRAGWIVRSRRTDKFIIGCIFLNCAILAIDRPIRSKTEDEITDWIQFACTLIFWGEMILKIVWYGPAMYSANAYNRIDIIVNLTGAVDLVVRYLVLTAGADALERVRILRIFRALRALRFLRLLTRSAGLRIMMSTALQSVGPVLNVMSASLLVFTVFAIVGMQLLSGILVWCSDPTIFNEEQCTGYSPLGELREWYKSEVNFNWIGDALISVYIICSQDHWTKRMYTAMDATSTTTGPSINKSSFIAIFYIIIIFMGAFFLIAVGVGVLVNTFNAAAFALDSMQPPPSKPTRKQLPYVFDAPTTGKIRRILYRVGQSRATERFVSFCIMLNVGMMGLESWKISQTINIASETANFFFTQIFAAEAVIQLVGTHPRQYFNDHFNTFDVCLVIASFATIAIEAQIQNAGAGIVNPRMLRIVRVLRILRTLRAIRVLKSLKELSSISNVILKSSPIIANLFLLLLLIFFAFGVLGVAVFSHLCTAPNGIGSAGGSSFSIYSNNLLADRCDLVDSKAYLSANANFQHLGMAMMLLFRLSTRDMWSETMFQYGLSRSDFAPAGVRLDGVELAKKALFNYTQTTDPIARMRYIRKAQEALPVCQTNEELQILHDAQLITCATDPCMETCGSWFALFYFPAFVSLSSSILFNIITAVLMRQLMQSEKGMGGVFRITPTFSLIQLERTRRIWGLNARIKERIRRRLLRRLQALVLSHALGLEEFEVLIADLTEAFRRAPTEAELKKLDLSILHAQTRQTAKGSKPGRDKDKAVNDLSKTKIPSMEEWRSIEKGKSKLRSQERSAVLQLVLDVRASKVTSSSVSGNKRRARFQRKLKQDLCHLLQCPDHQIVCLEIKHDVSGESAKGQVDDYGYAAVKVVILPVSEENKDRAMAVGIVDGMKRYDQEPHKLVADLLGFLASQTVDEGDGTATDNFLLPISKCAIVSVQVLSGAAVSNETACRPGEETSGAGAASSGTASGAEDLQAKLAKAMRMSDRRRMRMERKVLERAAASASRASSPSRMSKGGSPSRMATKAHSVFVAAQGAHEPLLRLPPPPTRASALLTSESDGLVDNDTLQAREQQGAEEVISSQSVKNLNEEWIRELTAFMELQERLASADSAEDKEWIIQDLGRVLAKASQSMQALYARAGVCLADGPSLELVAGGGEYFWSDDSTSDRRKRNEVEDARVSVQPENDSVFSEELQEEVISHLHDAAQSAMAAADSENAHSMSSWITLSSLQENEGSTVGLESSSEWAKSEEEYSEDQARFGFEQDGMHDVQFSSLDPSRHEGRRFEYVSATLDGPGAKSFPKATYVREASEGQGVARKPRDDKNSHLDNTKIRSNLALGSHVRVAGLQSAAAAHLNGTKGRVLSFAQGAGRVVVEVDDEFGTRVDVSLSNLNPVLPTSPHRELDRESSFASSLAAGDRGTDGSKDFSRRDLPATDVLGAQRLGRQRWQEGEEGGRELGRQHLTKNRIFESDSDSRQDHIMKTPSALSSGASRSSRTSSSRPAAGADQPVHPQAETLAGGDVRAAGTVTQLVAL